MSNQTSCIYCGSKSYGKSCPFSDHKYHYHVGDPTKCSWCGSKSLGPGCPFNPFGKTHVRGTMYNQMIKDSVGSGIIGGYVISKLSEPITSMKAYKLGLIDENGKKIKEPSTQEEIQSLGIVEKYILNLKSVVGNKLDICKNLTEIQLEESVSFQDYEKICSEKLKLNDKIKDIVNQFKECLEKAYADGLSSSAIEKLIIENFLDE